MIGVTNLFNRLNGTVPVSQSRDRPPVADRPYIRTPHPGEVTTNQGAQTRRWGTMTREVLAMADWLAA